MAKQTNKPEPQKPAPAPEPEQAPVKQRRPDEQMPGEVELTTEDHEAIRALAKEKAAAGLSLGMALEVAENQVREDKTRIYERVRSELSPKKGEKQETAKA